MYYFNLSDVDFQVLLKDYCLVTTIPKSVERVHSKPFANIYNLFITRLRIYILAILVTKILSIRTPLRTHFPSHFNRLRTVCFKQA